MCGPKGIRFLRSLGLKQGIDFDNFGLKSSFFLSYLALGI